MTKTPTTRAGVKRRPPYWKEARAKELLRAAASSRLSLRAFAEREGLPLARLVRWQARLQPAAQQQTVFREITPVPRVQPQGASCLELVLAGGRVVRVPVGFDGESLRRLVGVLEGTPC